MLPSTVDETAAIAVKATVDVTYVCKWSGGGRNKRSRVENDDKSNEMPLFTENLGKWREKNIRERCEYNDDG